MRHLLLVLLSLAAVSASTLASAAPSLHGGDPPVTVEVPDTPVPPSDTVEVVPAEPPATELPRSLVYMGYTMGGWFMSELDVLHQLSIGFWYRFESFTFGTRLTLGLDHVDDHGLPYDLFSYAIRFSPMVRIDLPYLDVMFGPGLGVAILNQQVEGEDGVRQTGRFDASLALGLDIHLHEHFTIMTMVELSVYAFVLNDDVAIDFGPEASLAFGWRF